MGYSESIKKITYPNSSVTYATCFTCVCAQFLSCVRLFVTQWTVTCQAPLSMEFSRQECWSGLPFPTPGYLPNPGIEPTSPALSGRFFTIEPPGKPYPFPLLIKLNVARSNINNTSMSSLPKEESSKVLILNIMFFFPLTSSNFTCCFSSKISGVKKGNEITLWVYFSLLNIGRKHCWACNQLGRSLSWYLCNATKYPHWFPNEMNL